MANLVEGNFGNAIKTQYERRLLVRAVARLVHSRFGRKATVSKAGSLEWRKYGALGNVTTALTEGTTPAEQAAPALTLVTATPLFYGAWIGFSDELTMTALDPIVTEVTGILGEQAGVSIDTLVRNGMTAGATKDYSGNQSARANLDAPQHDVTYADFVKQIAALEAANARPVSGENYVVIIHPYTWASLLLDPTFVNLFQREQPSPLRKGFVGTILRCEVYVTANSRSYVDGGVGSTTDVYSMLFIGAESYGTAGMAGLTPKNVDNQGPTGKNMTGAGSRAQVAEVIMKPLGSAGALDPLNQRGTVAWKTTMDDVILDSTWIRDLEHTNAFSDD